MKTGSLRTVAVLCGLALAAAGSAGCASRARTTRDNALLGRIESSFGFSGRKLALELGQAAPVQLRSEASRLDEGFLLLLAEPNHVEAFDRNDLSPAWVYSSLPGALRYPPTLTPISVLLMSGNTLHEVDRRYGGARSAGAIHFDLAPSSAFGGSAGTAYVPCWGGSGGEKTLRTINLVTGLEGWGYRTPGDIRGGVVVGGTPPRQTVYFATDGGIVYAIPAAEASARAPEVSWSADTRGPVTAPLVVEGDELFCASESGFLYCMDRVTGGIKWAAPHEVPLTDAPAATKKSVYQRRESGLWCHDRATGNVRWKLRGGARLVVERDGKSLVADANGDLVLVAADGSVTGRMPSGGYYFPTNLADESLFAVADDGFLFKLEQGGE
jgi:outer membrane protein assembly factor BamB